jgi:hypothetical protein
MQSHGSTTGGGRTEIAGATRLTTSPQTNHPQSRTWHKIELSRESGTAVTEDSITILPGSRFRAAMVLAVLADALQIVVFPMFVEGALSPADDLLDVGVAAALVHLLGWHWEFLPSFLVKLVPGVDLVPFWTMAVANVYRKSKQDAVAAEESREQQPTLKGEPR